MEGKKTAVVIRKAPHGTIYVHEALDVIFILGSYSLDLSLIFTGDGVMALKTGQDTAELGSKGFAASMGALADWDITQVYVDRRALEERNIREDELISIGTEEDTDEPLRPKVIGPEEIAAMLHTQDAVLSF